MQPFLALISPVTVPTEPPPPSGAHPDHTLPGDLPHPEHPIYYPLPPGAPVDPDYGIPEDGPHPDHELPGAQPRPDHDLPPFPSHPIVLPPGGGGWLPVYIWGPTDPRPTPPIVIPEPGEPPPPEAVIEWKAMWTPTTGWVTIGVVVPEGPVPTPSRARSSRK